VNDEYACSGWCCTDCLVLLANGDDPAEMTETEISEWHAEINRRNAGYHLTLGMIREEHECASNYTVTTVDGISHEVRADNENDVRDQFEFGNDLPIVSIASHDLQTDGDRGGDDFCEVISFSWSPCDVCGSSLGGERHAVSFWRILEKEQS
jgi:hypothetical protein